MAVLARHRHYEHQDLWDKFWKDKYGKVVVWQRPNILLWGWAVITVASLFVPYGKPADLLWILSMVVLAAWSLLEIFKGVNYFRRSLGVVILLFVVMAALHKI